MNMQPARGCTASSKTCHGATLSGTVEARARLFEVTAIYKEEEAAEESRAVRQAWVKSWLQPPRGRVNLLLPQPQRRHSYSGDNSRVRHSGPLLGLSEMVHEAHSLKGS